MKPKYEREFDQVEAIRVAQRRGEWVSRKDPRYALGFAYLDRQDCARRAAQEERKKKSRLTDALRGAWWNKHD